jgi:hypothetical protein
MCKETIMKYYFVRVNGKTSHDDPRKKDCFVAVEPNSFKRASYSNYLNYCFENNIVRIGWPDVGDLRTGDRQGAKSNCYYLASLKPHIRQYLLEFRKIQPGSILIVPDRDNPGDIYISEVVEPYRYDLRGPYECSHRVGVKWDRDQLGRPILYTSGQLGISKGGWWLRAFHEITEPKFITRISMVRERKEE